MGTLGGVGESQTLPTVIKFAYIQRQLRRKNIFLVSPPSCPHPTKELHMNLSVPDVWVCSRVKSCHFSSSGAVSLCITSGDVNAHRLSSYGDSVCVCLCFFPVIYFICRKRKILEEKELHKLLNLNVKPATKAICILVVDVTRIVCVSDYLDFSK